VCTLINFDQAGAITICEIGCGEVAICVARPTFSLNIQVKVLAMLPFRYFPQTKTLNL